MDVKLLMPFVDGLKNLLEQFEVSDIKRGKLEKKSNLNAAKDVNVIIGFQKDLKGNVVYSMSFDTAKNIVSCMMGGMSVTEYDENVESGICEFINMVSGYSVTSLGNLNIMVENTYPTLISGKKVYLLVSRVQTVMLEMLTPMGSIEIGIGIEQ